MPNLSTGPTCRQSPDIKTHLPPLLVPAEAGPRWSGEEAGLLPTAGAGAAAACWLAGVCPLGLDPAEEEELPADALVVLAADFFPEGMGSMVAFSWLLVLLWLVTFCCGRERAMYPIERETAAAKKAIHRKNISRIFLG